MSKRLAQVLRAGEAHAHAQEKKNWFNELPPEINEKILDKLPQSALQSCELVRNLCASGALSCDTREHLLGLLRRIFFDPRSQYSSTNDGVESTLRVHFGDEAVATPAALKTLLGQLCEAYVVVSDAILAMNPSMVPWLPATAFGWPAIHIPYMATKHPLVPGDPQPIHAFLHLREAADLLGNYHNLVVQEVTEREVVKNHALTKYDRLYGRPGARRVPWTTVEVEPGPDYRRLFNAYEGSWIEVNSATRLGQLPPGFSDRRFQPLWHRKYELVRLKVEFRADDTVREYKWLAKKRSKVSSALDEVFRIYPDR